MSKIVFIGDSLTKGAGYGGVTTADTFAYKIGIANNYAAADIVNAGVSSDTSAGVLARLPTDVYPHAPTVCVVGVGINDWSTGVSAATYSSNLASIFAGLNAHGIRPVFLSSPVYRGTGAQFIAYRSYIRAADDVCEENSVPVIDLYRDLCQEYFCIGDAAWNLLYADVVHLSKSGHQYVASMASRERFSGIFL